ncbi:hypothetical protein BUY35_00290 [Staphylococcus cohnii]|uniref:AbrB/MazE/SpoVT family DNA-binding domain-containing protein n=1 Tax=Staphylococcus saprophyticus TaxID=29385 RepID=UPI000D1E0020|nr:hypothetical protein [Staphylococcus saprophyticus]PTK45061.1 hypothetical protein BUZ69_11895 [Staphylococcus saprophyticus]RIM32761.1 hypothetical protein BUY35_00290 [Staphylococcus cohnii]
MKKSQAKVYKSGNGQVISVRKRDLERAGFQIGDNLDVEVSNSQISLIKSHTFQSEWQSFIENGGQYERSEYDWRN